MKTAHLLWTGRVLTGLVAAFLVIDATTKLIMVAPVIQATKKLSLPVSSVRGIGITLLVCTTIYVIPRTAVLGAILITGYLGGAMAIHVRAASGMFPVVFSAAFAILAWVGIVLREPRLFWLILTRQ